MAKFLKNDKRRELFYRVEGFLGKWLVDLLFFTTRIRYRRLSVVKRLLKSRKLIFAFWHSRILLISYVFKGINAAILVSASDDGEYIARVLQQQGHDTIRGSSRKGGMRALARLIKCMKSNSQPGVMIPDGPRGPRFEVQPGVLILSKKTGYPILPLAYSAQKIKIFTKSWDRFILPWPFTRCLMVFGTPFTVPADANDSVLERYRRKLKTELNRITREADSAFGHEIR